MALSSYYTVHEIIFQDALVVGDTLADMGMGRSANLGGTVGVLSGVCGSSELRPQADHIVSI